MSKAYWVSSYRAIHDPEKLAAYLRALETERGAGE